MVDVTDAAWTDQPDADVLALAEDEGLLEPAPEAPVEYDVWADRRLAVIARLDAEIARNDAAAAAHVAIIEARRDENNAVLRRQRDWLEAQLLEAARSYPYPKGTKSRRLSFGEIGTRKVDDSAKVVDRKAVLEWIASAIDSAFSVVAGTQDFNRGEVASAARAVRESIDIRTTPLRDWIASTGETIPGVEFVPGGEKPYVRVKGGDDGR